MLPKVCKFIVLIAVATFGFNQPAQAFMFFSKNVYSSPVEGTIHLNGKPLAGLVVKREIKSGGLPNDQHLDQTITNSQGHFSLPEVSNRTLLTPNWMSANPFVSQFIHVEYQNEGVNIWLFTKRHLEIGSEIDPNKVTDNSKVLKLNCDFSKINLEVKDAPYVICSGNGRRGDDGF